MPCYRSASRESLALNALALVVLATPALAQVPEPVAPSAAPAASPLETPEYNALIDKGLAEYDAGNFPEARALLSKAHALYSTARSLWALGMVEFELRNYPQSIDYLQQALASDVMPLGDDRRAKATELLGRARGFVARVHVDVLPVSAHAQLLVDGVPAQLPPDGSLTLQVGDHLLTARGDTGYRTEKRKLNVKGGEEQSISMTLTRELLQPIGEAKPTPLYKSPWLWTGAGVVAVGTAIALALLLGSTEVGAPVTTSQTPPGAKIDAHGRF
jgi:hypothetical protein